MKDVLITVAIPCYNERELAVRNTLKVHSFLKSNNWNFELLLCDDASDDGTGEMLDQMKEPEIRVYHYKKGPSRRENLAVTLAEGKGDILFFMDMDLSTDLESFAKLVNPVIEGSVDLAVGSRYQKGADVDREFFRWLYSVSYNKTIQLLLGSKMLDHQCGFKAFRRDIFLSLVQEMGYDEQFRRGWFWDAELLIRSQRRNLRILELPVRWISAEKSSFNFVRELKVIPYMLNLRRRLGKSARQTQ